MPIDAIDITRYPRDGSPYTTKTAIEPSWDVVAHELRSMHNWEKPILWLHQDRNVGDRNCLAVCGGSGIYHVQIAIENGRWLQAVDPEGSDEEVDVWLSDQGFTTEAKYTWRLDDALELVRWYYDHGNPNPKYSWD